MDVPSTKGVLIQHAVERIQGYLAGGRLSREELELRLAAEDLALFDGEKVIAGLWYPVARHHRLLDLIFEVEGRSEPALVDLGRTAGEQMLRAAAFGAMFEAAARRGEGSAGALLVKLAELVLNFTKWRFLGPSLADFRIEVTEAREVSDHARHNVTGLIEVIGSHVLGRALGVTSERPQPDRILFHGKAREAA
jgi:hypothetical protein